MATTNIGQVSIVPMGAFSLGTTYKRLSVVTYNGSSYIAKVDNVNKPITDSTVWYLLASKGDKGDTYEVTPEDLQEIADQITSDASSAFNVHVTEKTTEFDNHVTSKTGDFDTNASNKTTTFNGNATDKTTAFNNNASSKTTDFNTNASDKTTAFNSNAQNKVDYYNENADELIAFNEELLDQIPTATAEGTAISVTDSSNLPLADIQIKGNASQVTSTGKNLANPLLENGTIDGTTGENVVNDNYRRMVNYIDVGEATTLYLKRDSEANLKARYYNSNFEYVGTGSPAISTVLERTLTVPTGARYLKICVDNSDTNYFTAHKLIISKEDIPYEPYTGGIPSPNPDYPQPISVVTGDNTVKAVGKNLFNLNKSSDYKPFANYTISGQSIVVQSTDNTTNGYCVWNIPVDITKEYTISYGSMTSESEIGANDRVQYGFSDIPVTTRTQVPPNIISKTTQTATATATGKYLALVLRVANLKTYTISNIQVEVNSTATAYEPYTEQSQLISLGTMELAKIGDYEDYIYKSEGKWYLEKQLGKIIMDENSAITQANIGTSNTLYKCYIALDNIPLSTDDSYTNLLCDKLRAVSYGTIYNEVGEGLSRSNTANNRIYFGVLKSRGITSTATFKTWLGTNNLTVYYPFETPTITEITDTTLIGQLDNLLAMKTNRNITNMFTATDNELPTLAVLYRQDLATLFNNLTSAILSLGNNT